MIENTSEFVTKATVTVLGFLLSFMGYSLRTMRKDIDSLEEAQSKQALYNANQFAKKSEVERIEDRLLKEFEEVKTLIREKHTKD
jgi:hypothetical protein